MVWYGVVRRSSPSHGAPPFLCVLRFAPRIYANVFIPSTQYSCARMNVNHNIEYHRWCPTYPDYFAISTGSPAKGAAIHVHNVAYPQAPPTAFQIAPRPLCVRAFDFVAGRGIPRIVAAVGRDVVVFYIGVDS